MIILRKYNMKIQNIYRFLSVLLIGLLLTGVTFSREFVGSQKSTSTIKSTAAGCSAASGFRFLDINNVRTRINTGGDMWWDLPGGIGAQYYIPKSGTATSMFSGSLWIGGLDINNQLKLAAIRYRQVGNDYWPGPLTTDGTAAVDQETCAKYDKHFPITRLEVDEFLGWFNSDNRAEEYPGYTIPKSITDWPAHGDVAKLQSYYLAPFRDVDGDGEYDYNSGDYPYYDLENELCPINFAGDPNYIPARTMEEELTEYKVPMFGSILVDQVIKGDQTLWWVFNDKGNTHTETQGSPIGMEVRAQAFAFATNDEINNMTFYSYEVINRSTFELTQTYFCPWVDTDLGYAWDDYVGCDVLRGLGYCYNGPAIDGNGEIEAYGSQPPAIGVDFFQGPYIDPDGWDNPRFTGDCNLISQGNNFAVDQMAINGVNFGNGIVDDERYGMRRFVYHNNTSSNPATTDPGIASEYYNFLRGIWKDNSLMYYGGTAHSSDPAAVGPVCEFMFPGDSDPCNWGTKFQPPNGGFNQNGKYWTEEQSGNQAGDRRFMQSAGPFTLKPGAVNYITVGIPWARASAGGPWASVELLRVVDDKCQALFDNCFKVIDGPNAPDLVVRELDRELIMYLVNPKGSNNYQEKYAEFDPNIIQPNPSDPTKRSDSLYRFEGYQIFQLKNASVSLGDAKDAYGNYNPDLVRLVAQFDVKNGVGRIINHYFNKAIGFNVPVVEVDGGDEGIQHSFRLTDDAFATGDKRLVNHKQYYYTVVAYAYNEYLPYDPEDQTGKFGQKSSYLAGRKNILTYTAIPHKTVNGLVMNADYGDGPAVTRIEGQGNDGMSLEFKKETVAEILSKKPVGTVVNGDTVSIGHPDYPIAYEAKYVNGQGPVNVKIIDPLNVSNGKYTLKFDTLYKVKNYNITGNPALDAGGDTASIVTGSWHLIDESTGQTYYSDATLDQQNEQLFLDLGISVNMKSIYTPGPKKVGQITQTSPFGTEITPIWEILTENNSLLESSLIYEDSSYRWLGGLEDLDEPGDPRDWIRAGTYQVANESTNPANDYSMPNKPLDPNQNYEKIINGTWAPYLLCAANDQNNNGPAYTLLSKISAQLEEIYSVDIVFTPDKSKWTRSAVIEMCPDANLSQGKVPRFRFRGSPSVDKDGNFAAPGIGPSDDPNAPNYIADSSMSWFPGYAINVETGERMNIMFGEDSWKVEDNGRDMLFNPTSSVMETFGEARFGGKHYVYVMNHITRNPSPNSRYDFPAYDGCKYIRNIVKHFEVPAIVYMGALYSSVAWVGIPLAVDDKDWLDNEARVRIRVAKPYSRYYSTPADSILTANSQNRQLPMYRFETESVATEFNNTTKAKTDLDLIQIVPNPYYAYAGGPGYERNALDNRVKITNLPEQCVISIYNVSGTLIRQLTKDEAKTSVDWDLKNFAGVPIAGGVYIIHVKADSGEKIIKWFGGLRTPDLNVF
jgi:hypothetical protein